MQVPFELVPRKGKQVLVFFPLIWQHSSTDPSCRGGKIFGFVSDVDKATTGDIYGVATKLTFLKTKRNLLYIRNQSVPRCKHFPPRL